MEPHDSTAPASPATNPPLALLDVKRVREITCFSTSYIYEKVKNGTFPAPLPLGKKCVRWRSTDVQQWLEAL
jgi:prophage regulatory protein